jgi:uncharacterized protein (TIGR00730 family)
MPSPPEPALRSLCVFCGANRGNDARFAQAARAFGTLLAEEGVGVVYGGGHVGLMGELADAALAAGGRVIGVIPDKLVERELAHRALSELRVVRTMHERKATMASLADAFVALPGGIGTLEEFFEVWTWAQLGYHEKPLGLLDVSDFFRPLSEFLASVTEQGFLREAELERVLRDSDGPALLARLRERLRAGTVA